MSRKIIAIEKDKAKAIIDELEKDGPLTNRSILGKKVAELYYQRYNISFSFSFLCNKIIEWGLEIKTPKGQRGIKGGNIDYLKQWRESGETSKKKVKADATPFLAFHSKEENGKFFKLAKSVKRGSLKSAIKLMCLGCTCYDKTEIKYCACPTCPLFLVRPYQPETTEEYLANSSPEVKRMFDVKSSKK